MKKSKIIALVLLLVIIAISLVSCNKKLFRNNQYGIAYVSIPGNYSRTIVVESWKYLGFGIVEITSAESGITIRTSFDNVVLEHGTEERYTK